MSTLNTPGSEKSLYFDAPVAHFTMSTPPIPQDNLKEGMLPVGVNGTTPEYPSEPVADVADPAAQDLSSGQQNPPIQDSPPQMPDTLQRNESSGWLPATDFPENGEEPTQGSRAPRKGSILRKRRSMTSTSAASSIHRSGSVNERTNDSQPRRSSLNYAPSIGKRSVFTNVDGKNVDGSTFINGAGTTGPAASAAADESMHARAASAEANLSSKQKSKIRKSEVKEGKRLSKIIKQEAKAEKHALEVAIKELAELQKHQKDAVKREAKVHTTHSKALSVFQKHEAVYLAARTKYETAQAQLNSEAEALDISRSNAREATERMQEKSQEVDSLRTMFGVDARERAAKLDELNGGKSSSLFC